MDRESVQRVLRDRRRAHEARACYPCQQRKVKCDKSQPCRTCQRRGHPEICTSFDVQTSGSQQRRPGRDSSRRRTPPGMAGERERQATRPGVSAAGIASPGQDSVSAILTSKVSSPNDEPLARDVRAVLGLQNTLTSYLFMEHNAQGDAVDALMAIAPQRNDIVRFYQHYRTHVAPFNPILLNTDRFELDLSAYLKAEAAGELRNRQKLVEGQWASRNGVSFIALLLSIVASGAHFSDDRESTSASHTFAKRSFHALRLANFLFQPSTSDIQTLLILGNTLQNTGQSDAAWALLGTTVRLAQTIAFTSDGDLGINREAVTETQLLRSRVQSTAMDGYQNHGFPQPVIFRQDHPQHVPAEQPPLYNPTGSSSGLYTDADTSNATDPYFFQPSLGSSNQPLGLDLSEVGMDGLSPLAYLNYFMNGPVTNSLPNDGPYFQ
ncbi:hypothetical protein NKR23_g11454 [Pleurostoma richardsiae]|uniref:Zn(2)-C6 fungal-type domain-containing protein n=1 Tax=Pleurostoma richardsiae TaxID=41990 RepID=A0AA38VBF8_9PEZI|nr:hypothetical protein NKR23_g11454 [Pleurostoma richardsiae]